MPKFLPEPVSGSWKAPISVNTGGAYYVFDGLDIDCENRHNLAPDGEYKALAGFNLFDADRVVIKNSRVRKCGSGVSVSGSSNISIENNNLFDLVKWPLTGTSADGGRGDANAVVLERGSTRVLIQDNNSGGNTGDGVQCTGVEQPNNVGFPPVSHLTIRNNVFANELENGVDIKSCEDVTISGNDMSGYKHAQGNGGSCGGPAIVIHYFAKRVLVEDNNLHDSGAGVIVGSSLVVGTVDPPRVPRVENVVIRRNRIWGMNQLSANNLFGCGDGIKLQHFSGVEIVHNTFDKLERSGVRIDPNATTPSENVQIWNNIIQDARGLAPGCTDFSGASCSGTNTGGALDLSTGFVTGVSIHDNLYWHSNGAAATRFRHDASAGLSFSSWAPLASDTHSDNVAPLLLGNFRLGPNSPALNGALPDSSNLGQRCSGNPDLGAIESDCVPVPLWTHQRGGEDTDGFADVTVTSTGDIWVVGSTSSTSVFGGVAHGGSDAFIGHYSPSGTPSPIIRFGTDGFDYATAITRDANDNIIVVGSTTGNLFKTKPGGLYDYDAFIVKYDPTGTTILWRDQFGAAESDSLTGVVTDANGDIYAVGDTSGSIDGTNQGGTDRILVKYSAAGVQQWVEQSGTALNDTYSSLSLAGNVLAIRGRTSTAGVAHDVIVSHGPGKNSVNWTASEPAASNLSFGRPAVDGSGNIYVPVNYDGYSFNRLGVRKYSPTGALTWSTLWNGGDWGQAAALSLDSQGNIVVVGKNYYEGERFWKVSSNGVLEWSGGITNTLHSQAHAVATIPTGGFVVVGMTYTTGLFGTSGGWEDGWIAKLP
ncbi:right-handed parallel beta-helix repeat-containing protein [Archangium violaceum]|uniref:right-handed parallel beta-helix repeat-containing protein n=1 Tax=Archangium violaceum TaxID=83451 RepID=UPI00194EAFA2|nr:right-handed parallel beta-helix repeat-containing protein [Archangium violaceum]QRO00670.1 right-handed parallel beta-helix repeat-containing protein [Archangium violaceum]